VAPTIQQLQRHAEQILDSEWSRVGGRLSHLSARDRDAVDTLLRGVVNKLLRPPILHLKEAAGSGNGYHEVEHVRAIFGLQPEAERKSESGEEVS
jgi:glutamyl-tRNA reductase